MFKSFFLFLLLINISVFSKEINPFREPVIVWNKVNSSQWYNLEDWRYSFNHPNKTKFIKEKKIKKLAGIIVDKIGTCKILSNGRTIKGEYRSRIFQGFEIETEKESICWIMLLDGSLIRISPNSSVTLNEFKIDNKKYFFFIRFNKGNNLFLSRFKSQYVEKKISESENIFLPPLVKKARIDFEPRVKPTDYLKLPKRVSAVYKKLNKLIIENNKKLGNYEAHYLFSTNVAIFNCRGSIEFENYTSWGSGTLATLRELNHFQKANPGSCHTLRINNETEELHKGKWIHISANGKNIDDFDNHLIHVNEQITSNIPSMYLVREYLFKKFEPILNRLTSKLKIKNDFGLKHFNPMKNNKSLVLERLRFLNYFVQINERNLFKIAKNRKISMIMKKNIFKMDDYFYPFLQTSLKSRLFYKPFRENVGTDYIILNSTKKKLWKKIHERRLY